jgi:hypothetical protein
MDITMSSTYLCFLRPSEFAEYSSNTLAFGIPHCSKAVSSIRSKHQTGDISNNEANSTTANGTKVAPPRRMSFHLWAKKLSNRSVFVNTEQDNINCSAPPQTRPQIHPLHLVVLREQGLHSVPLSQTFLRTARRNLKMNWVHLFDQRMILRRRECRTPCGVVDPTEHNTRLLLPGLRDEPAC